MIINTYIKFFIMLQITYGSIKNDTIKIIPIEMKYKKDYKNLSEDERIKNQNISTIHTTKNDFDKSFDYYLSISTPLLKKHVILTENNKFIGYIGFFYNDTYPNVIFIYYAIIPSEWGKGLATIAVKKFINMFKDTLKNNKFKKIKATVKIENIGSKKVLLKNGFHTLKDENNEDLIEYIDGESVVYVLELNI